MKSTSVIQFLAVTTVLATFITGCGGAGSGGSIDVQTNNAVSTDPQGFYSGNLANVTTGRTDLKLLVLENNEVWAIYGSDSLNGFTPKGFIHAGASLNESTLTSTSLNEFEILGDGMTADGTFGGALSLTVTQESLKGTLEGDFNPSNGQHQLVSASLAVTYPSATQYSYDTPALISDISGAWTISGASGASLGMSTVPYNLSVASNGQFTIQAGTCSLSGLIYPRPSSKNVFNVSFNGQSSVNCLHAVNASGVAILYSIPGTALHQLLIVSSGYDSDLYAGVR